jgi:hypothetical protein
VQFYDRLLAAAAVPDRGRGALDGLPAQGSGASPRRSRAITHSRDSDYLSVRRAKVTPEHFETFQAPVIRGRPFSALDAAQSSVAIVNESFARIEEQIPSTGG